MKLQRHNAILKLISTVSVTSQDELRRRLVRQGFDVTQATLSRDLHELRLMKGPTGYSLPQNGSTEVDDDPTLDELMSSFGISVVQAQNQLVLRTSSGAAQPVGAGIDREEWEEVLGTIAGDDTILVICADPRQATVVRERLARKLES
jgi:transcriptional regulator of arginine metabolism